MTNKSIVIGPDGMPIEVLKQYENKEEAEQAIRMFVDKYRAQGYYYKEVTIRTKISIDDLADECRIVEI